MERTKWPSLLEANDDVVDRRDGRISISLVSGENYTLGQVKTAIVDIADNDDPPVFSISPISIHGVEEGEPAQFLLSSATAPSSDTDINLDVNSAGGYLAEGQDALTITFPAEQTEHVFRVDTADNNEISEQGTIQVAIQTSDDYETEEPTMAEVAVYDNEGPPVISVQTSTENEINEGQTATFFITSQLIHTIDLQVAIEISYQGEFFEELVPNKTIKLPSGRKTQIFTVETINDLVDEQDGLVTVLIASSTDYVISEDEQATITIKDNDDLPTLSIHAENSHVVEEGEDDVANAKFNIWSTTISQVNMTINFNIKQTGGFQIWRAPRNVTMVTGNRTTSISFPITNDNEYNPEAELTITLLPSSDSTYNLSTNNRATIKIDDQADEPDPNDPVNPVPVTQPRISVASAVVTALTQELIGESSPVEVSIVAENPTVELGNPANFVIAAEPASTTDQTINILVEKANTETTEISNEEIMLRAGEVSVNYTVNTGSTEFMYANSTISVQIMPRINYSIPNNIESNTASVTILNSQELATPSEEIIQTGEVIFDLLQRKLNESTRNVVTQRSNRKSDANPAPTFALAGETNLQNIITKSGHWLNERDNNWWSIIDQTAFEIELNPNQFANQSTVLWGIGNNYEFNRNVNSNQNSVTGDMFIGQTGFETSLHHNTQLGLATSITDGSAEYLDTNLHNQDSTTYQYQNVAIQPYLIWDYAENSSIWLSGTYGTTEMTFHSEKFDFKLGRGTDFTGMIGGRHQLFSSNDAWEYHNIKLGMSWNGSWSENFTQNLYEYPLNVVEGTPQFQLALNGDYQIKSPTDSALAISLDMNANWGRQNNDITNSTTMKSGIEFSNNHGWSIEGQGYASTKYDLVDQWWGLAGKLTYDNKINDEGFELELSTGWGNQYDSNNASELTSQSLTTPNQSQEITENQLSTRGQIAYGLGLDKFASVYTPSGGFEFNQDDRQILELGHEVEFDSNLNIEFKLNWKYQSLEMTERVANLRGGIKW